MNSDGVEISRDQYLLIRSHAKNALESADAFGRFPTPVADILEGARLDVSEEELSEGFLYELRHKAKQAGKLLKSAISKVLGVFDPSTQTVFLTKGLHLVRQVFLKLHETGHALLPWQRDIYYAIQDCEKTLAPEIAEVFESEANVFASEVLFQLDSLTNEAAGYKFGLRVPLKLSKKYGSSVYSTVRRYVSTNHRNCAVLVLNAPELVCGDGFRCGLRRVVISDSFRSCFGRMKWPEVFTPDDGLGRMIPPADRRMSGPVRIRLRDRNGVEHECAAEAFRYRYYVFILVHEVTALTRTIVAV
ncbi:MAG TPA: ImmA/IrrE family metallo-endopeptidase [Chthoniobacterales bacterium]|jgi:hypothetical protein|nr:ImmA/IrrE family metallo-endopeptidase [Chthoniobacterales bacterium]